MFAKGPLCVSCGKRARIHGENRCSSCRRWLFKKMAEDKYLTPTAPVRHVYSNRKVSDKEKY